MTGRGARSSITRSDEETMVIVSHAAQEALNEELNAIDADPEPGDEYRVNVTVTVEIEEEPDP